MRVICENTNNEMDELQQRLNSRRENAIKTYRARAYMNDDEVITEDHIKHNNDVLNYTSMYTGIGIDQLTEILTSNNK